MVDDCVSKSLNVLIPLELTCTISGAGTPGGLV